MHVREAFALINSERITGSTSVSGWADLGCGGGLFTMALSRMLTTGSIIYGIDKNSSLQSQVTGNGIEIIAKKLDFIHEDLGLQDLNGILMANAIHYVRDKGLFIRRMEKYMKPGAFFLIVEYDTDMPVARWIPYPLSFLSMTRLFTIAGYSGIRKISERPSVYGNRTMYSALVEK